MMYAKTRCATVARPFALPMALGIALSLVVCAAAAPAEAATPNKVTILRDAQGFKLQVDGKDFMVLGMNWAHMPIGENYSYDFWSKPDAFIKEALKREMGLMQKMGGNAIRQYVGIPARWITYIYEEYGIYTILNHPLGRYGLTVDGVWTFPTNYGDKRTREIIRQEVVDLVKEYKDTPGLLMWLLGNENNYGLVWKTTEIEDLPPEAANQARAEQLYSLFGESIRDIKKIDPNHPVAIANGDLGYIDLIVKYCQGLDIMGSNVYRGASSTDLFAVVKEKLDMPFLYTEFGADAYNAKEKREDHLSQAEYLRALWQEIYEQSHGKGRIGNAIGGLTFQWSDGWWKYRQEVNLDVHDTNASWANNAYTDDFVEGENNMNEEWFGICAKGRTDPNGQYELYPRSGYYVLQRGYQQDPYAATTTLESIREHWSSIDPKPLSTAYEVSAAQEKLAKLELLSLENLRMELETFTTDGRRLSETNREQRRFDHLESFYIDLKSRPASNLTADLSLNILGNVPDNPIDEIFYERRGKPVGVMDDDGDPVVLDDLSRVKVYRASIEWEEKWFSLRGLYRQGHYHWGYEGDFFGLYREANYGESIDIYDSNVPLGVEVDGKRSLEGLKLAFGPEVYWGANPMFMAKYERKVPELDLDIAIVHQEEVAQRVAAEVSNVIPTPQSRRTSIYLARSFGSFKLEIGGLMAGTPLIDEPFERAEDAGSMPSYLNSGFFISDDTVRLQDTLGGKAKLTYSKGPINWYAQGAYKGIVADGGPDQTLTFTGWRLKENGRGNHYNVLTGAAVTLDSFQIAPNFIYQKPLVAALPQIDDFFDPDSGTFFAGVAPRNVLDDPFVVRGNQEMVGYELLLAYDPTPATFMWAFDNDMREDALFAASVDFVWRDYRQPQDANIGVLGNGTLFSFDAAPPPEDLWEVHVRAVSNPIGDLRLVGHLYGARAQSNGSDERLIERFGGSLRATFQRWALAGFLKIDDWGPYDFHRDFNLTFPLQSRLDLSYGAVTPTWLGGYYTRFGVRGQLRLLNEFSPRIDEDQNFRGRESEVMTYLHITL